MYYIYKMARRHSAKRMSRKVKRVLKLTARRAATVRQAAKRAKAQTQSLQQTLTQMQKQTQQFGEGQQQIGGVNFGEGYGEGQQQVGGRRRRRHCKTKRHSRRHRR